MMDTIGKKNRIRRWFEFRRHHAASLTGISVRTRIVVGLTTILALSLAGICVAYFGYGDVSRGFAVYRSGVAGGIDAQRIEREVAVYQLSARYYVATGNEADAASALSSEADLGKAIELSWSGAVEPSRHEIIKKVFENYEKFKGLFAQILKLKRENVRLVGSDLKKDRRAVSAEFEALISSKDLSEEQDLKAALALLRSKWQEASANVGASLALYDTKTANSADQALTDAEVGLAALNNDNAEFNAHIGALREGISSVRKSFSAFVSNSRKMTALIANMSIITESISLDAEAAKNSAIAEEQRIQLATDRLISAKQQAVLTSIAVAALLGGLLAFLIGNGIARPIVTMCRAMREIAACRLEVVLPGLGRRDEIGQMAAAVEEFKVQAVAKATRSVLEQEEMNLAAAQTRRAEIVRFATEFETAVGAIVASVAASAGELEGAAGSLRHTVEITQELSGEVAGASEEASSNVRSVADATEELSSSVENVRRQVKESSQIAEGAVVQAREIDARIGKLTRAAERIGEVVQLINAIAQQTNLLALNATIEAARAGDSGKGFVIVAAEVKSLANQTAKATDDISAHVHEIQAATQESVLAIKSIGETIGKVSSITALIESSVDSQTSATQEIARNVQNVARTTQGVAGSMADVNRGATETGEASEKLLVAAKTLSDESIQLRRQLDKFMGAIRAA
jgi:methyl-accepting chemotaxis protein